MTKAFLNGAELGDSIREILAEDGARAAVAFWGHGCDEWVTGNNVRIIANLTMGGTNPHAFRKVRAERKHMDRLHAKVYIGANRAIVSSANASINGLALEGEAAAGWIEAGWQTDNVAPVADWFETLWGQARDIAEGDWRVAKALWNLRPRAKPPLRSFAEFDVTGDDLPFVTWVEDEQGAPNDEALLAELGTNDKTTRMRVAKGTGIRHDDDADILKNKWILCWTQSRNGRSIKGKPWFEQLSDVVVRKGYRYIESDELRDIVLAVASDGRNPFPPGEPEFVRALKEVLALEKYRRIHEGDEEGIPWFKPRQDLTRQFWGDLKQAYDNGKLP